MAKQYRRESKGRIDGSMSARGIFTVPHSPEQEQNMQRLIDQIRPLLMPVLRQAITFAVDENWEIHEGDVIQYIVNYITNYFNTYSIGQYLRAGNGIQISGDTISVRAGEGLEAGSGPLNVDLATDPGLQITGAKLEAKPDTTKGLDKDSDGLFVKEGTTVETGSGGGGGGIDIDSSGIRVDPEDFLYLG